MTSIDAAAVLHACRQHEADRRFNVRDPLPRPRTAVDATSDGPLRVVVLLPRTDVGGGARILCEHASRLHDRGHAVTALGHGPRPDWSGLRAPYVRVPWGLDLADAVPAADVVLAGYWDQVRAVAAATGVPVVHLEQGDAHLFEELPAGLAEEVRRCLQAADATITLSAAAQGLLRDRYGVQAEVVPNAVDRGVFRPGGDADERPRPYLVSVGWDGNAFKGLDVVRQVWERVRERGFDVDVVRISPHAPQEPWGEVVVRPEQPALAALLRGAALYLGASRYEAWGLPPLEAMACGTPVVSTANVGVLEYAEDGRDALLAPVDDVEALTDAVVRVLAEDGLAQRLRDGGLATAARYDWDEVVDRLEAQLRGVVRPAGAPDRAWTMTAADDGFVDPDGPGRLRAVLTSTAAREVQVPLLHCLPDGSTLARWETVARRKRGAGVQRLHAPLRAPGPFGGKGSATRRQVVSGQAERAVPMLLADLDRCRGPEQVVAARWLALALLRVGDAPAALTVALAGLQSAPDHADFARLGAVAAAQVGDLATAEVLADLAATVATGARHDEWFVTLPL